MEEESFGASLLLDERDGTGVKIRPMTRDLGYGKRNNGKTQARSTQNGKGRPAVKRTLVFTALYFSVLIGACGRSDQSDSGAPSAGRSDDPTLPSASSTFAGQPRAPCPRTGRWAICSVEKRLEQAGFVLRKAEGELPRRSGFSVQPVVYMLGRARLEVFVYPDENALTGDVAKLDTALAAPRGQANDWEIPPRFMRSANLAAVFLTRNEQQAERLTLAITAGPPQR